MPPGLPRIVVLDRDGVINHDSSGFIRSADEWRPLPGSLEAIARLTRAGIPVAVATNQSGLGRGLFTAADLDAIHAQMKTTIEAKGGTLAGIWFCPHRPEDHCDCRKPLPGLLQRIEQQLAVSLAGQPVVGDSSRDIEAAVAVGAQPVLVRTGNGTACEAEVTARWPVRVHDDLAAAVEAWFREAETV